MTSELSADVQGNPGGKTKETSLSKGKIIHQKLSSIFTNIYCIIVDASINFKCSIRGKIYVEFNILAALDSN